MASSLSSKLASLPGTRHVTWLSAIALSCMVAGLSTYEVFDTRALMVSGEREHLIQSAAAAEDMLAWRLEWARRAIERLAARLVVELEEHPDVAARHARVSVSAIPMIRAMVVARADGTAIATTAGGADDEALFPLLRDQISRVDGNTGDARGSGLIQAPRPARSPDNAEVGNAEPDRPIVVLMVPLVNEAGANVARVAAALSFTFLDDLTRYVTPPTKGSSASLVTGDGRILTRWPQPERFVGMDVARGNAFSAHRDSLSKTSFHQLVTSTDGMPKLVAARSLDFDGLPPLAVFVSREMGDIDEAWTNRAMIEAGQSVLVILAILAFAAMASRREQAMRTAAESIVERENLYHNLFHGSKATKLLIDPADGKIVDANMAAIDFYGWTLNELRSMNIRDINTLPPDEVTAEMERARRESRNHFLFRHRVASGDVRDVEVHSGPLSYRNRQLLYSLILDVTDRRRMERERQRLVTAIEQSRASVVITDVDGQIEYVNPAFTAITGYTLEEVRGARPNILKSGHTSDEEYALMWRTLTSGKPWSATFLNRRKDGGTYWEHAHISPVLDDDGTILNYVAVKENITAQKLSEETLRAANERLRTRTDELARANQELEQFAYVASHDLRQPLRAIGAYLRLLRDRLGRDIPPDAEEFIRFAEGGAKRMDALIVGLLEYSRVGRLSRPMAPVALGELIAISLDIFAFEIADRGAKVTVADGFPTVLGAEEELQRLFDNLIGNALKYGAPERTTEIAIGHREGSDGKSVEVWVADNGIGMAPENHARAFGMFQRLVAKEDYEGTGIGLAVCRKIVQHHGGTIRIESELGRGCRIVFTLSMVGEGDAGSAPGAGGDSGGDSDGEDQ